MRFRDTLNKIAFKFLSFRYEKGRQFYLSVFIAILIAIAILTLLTIKQSHDTKVKENVLKAVLNSNKSLSNPEDSKNISATSPVEEQKKITAEKIKVYICGYINNSGVYELNTGTRVIDLIDLAGGAKIDAYLESINLAEVLKDGQKVYIPSKEEASNPGNSIFLNGSAGNNSKSNIININSAGESELELLPGIGPELARRIIDYRTNAGSFKSKEDLKNVTGIGEKKFNAIKDLITV